MILKDNFFGIFGLAVKAGKAMLGTFACEEGVKGGKVGLVLLDAGASNRTKKDVQNMCKFFEIPLIEVEPEGMMGKRCGKDGLMLAGITDLGFTKRLEEIAKSNDAEV